MKSLTLFLLLMSTTTWSKPCLFEMKKDSLKVEWTAFKTPLKIGVKGSFEELGVVKDSKATTFSDMLKGNTFEIKTSSVNTGDIARDKKIHTFFFKDMKGGDTISGRILGYEKKILTILFNINGKEQTVPLKLINEINSFTATGHIDVLDFGLNSSLTALNKACETLHEGKTWSDVEISLSGKYLKSCK